jgi:hypothetical protein
MIKRGENRAATPLRDKKIKVQAKSAKQECKVYRRPSPQVPTCQQKTRGRGQGKALTAGTVGKTERRYRPANKRREGVDKGRPSPQVPPERERREGKKKNIEKNIEKNKHKNIQ